MKRKYLYSRTVFQTYLEGLDPNKTFCRNGRCPIAQFMYDVVEKDIGSPQAATLDEDYAKAVDSNPQTQQGNYWGHILPAYALKVLKDVQAEEIDAKS